MLTLRRILSVLAGLATTMLLSAGTDYLFGALGVLPPMEQPSLESRLFLITSTYRGIYAIACAYLTATLAPDRPMWHALVLGVVLLIASLPGAILLWGLAPAWYPISLVALPIPYAWCGAKLRSIYQPR